MYKKLSYSFIILYTVLGFLIAPFILKPIAVNLLEQELDAKVKISSVSFNPYLFILTFDDVELSHDNERLISFKSLEFDLELYALFAGIINIKEVLLDEPKVNLVYDKNKTFNFQNIIKISDTKTDDSNEKSTIPRIIFQNIQIRKGTLEYTDYTNIKKFYLKLNRIGFLVKNIDTKNNDKDSTLRLYSTLGDGGFIDINTKILALSPLTLDGTFAYESSKLYTQWRYLQDKLNLEVADGSLSVEAKYYFNADNLKATTISSLDAELNNLRIKPKSKPKDVLRVGSLKITNALIKPMLKSIDIKNIELNSLFANIKRDSNGKLDWVDFLKTNFTKEDKKLKKDKEDTRKWNVSLNKLSLEKITAKFEDSYVKPKVTTKVNDLNIHIQNFILGSKKEFQYDLNLFVNKDLRCSSSGNIVQNALDITSEVKCSKIDIVHYKAYINEVAHNNLKKFDLDLRSASLDFKANLHLHDDKTNFVSIVDNGYINLNKVILNKQSTRENLVKFKAFELNTISLNTKNKELSLEGVYLNNLTLFSKKYANKTINFESLIVAHDAKKKSSKVEKNKPYRIKVKEFKLKNSSIKYKDESLQKITTNTIDSLSISLHDIDSKDNTWLKYKLDASINSKGSIHSGGMLQHTPLDINNTTNIKRISLKEFSPYIQELSYARVDDGYLSIISSAHYSKEKNQADLYADGDVVVDELIIADERSNEYLLSFSNLNFNNFNYEMNPNRFFVNEVELDGLYVDAFINEHKELNLANLAKKVDSKKINVDDTKEQTTKATPVKIMKLVVKNSNARFADFSLPIKFKTDIHDLNGVVYSISNTKGEVSYVDIKGEVDKYGSTKLKGSIESANIKSFTDIDFNFRNLELKSLSGYSAEFAGYKIEDGKLYLDLGYEIYDSKLSGKNSVLIKNIELGEEIEDENSSSLPLGFAIALLEDSDGVIDINMPVEGDIDAPEFKYGALVFKTFVNMIVKAVASPFKFLGSMMGFDADELEYAEFEVGSTVILPPEIEKLDNISKILIKRPKVSISISPRYNAILDKKAIQTKLLIDSVMNKSKLENRNEYRSALTIDLLEKIYLEFKIQSTLDTLYEKLKLKYKDNPLAVEYQKLLIEKCLSFQIVPDSELKEIALKRATGIKNYLVESKSIDEKRINILDVTLVEDENDEWIKSKITIEIK